MNVVYRPPGPDELRSVGAVVALALLQAPHSDESWRKSEPTWQGCDTISAFDGASTRVVAVEAGLFASGNVEVSGPAIAEGMTIGMAQ